MKLPIASIQRTDLQARVATDRATVDEYAEAMRAGQPFHPILVYGAFPEYFLADGFHRLIASEEIGLTEIECRVLPGTREDAAWTATASNKSHGLKRTHADKRKAVAMAIALRHDQSDRAIAEHVGVSNHLVAELRREQVGEFPRGQKSPRGNVATCPPAKPLPPPPRVGRDGKTYPAKPAQPEPPKQVRRDGIGREIPEPILALWDEASQTQDMLTTISRLRVYAKEQHATKPHATAEVLWQRIQADLDSAYNALKVGLPYAVCPTCNGKIRKSCLLCMERGFISEHRWKTAVPTETKELLERLARES